MWVLVDGWWFQLYNELTNSMPESEEEEVNTN